MYTVEFRKVSKKFRGITIADEMDLLIKENTFSVLFGVPGSGKSTLLRLLTGLEKPDHGEILIYDRVVTRMKPGDRNIGYVPQSFALYPHYSVFDNIAYPLKLMGVAKRDFQPVVENAAQRLQITHLLDKRPDQCSGGEKQRVAIARGIVKNTKIFILDDPLTGLDFKLRERLFDDLRQMREDLQATFIYTTSDPLEALMLAEDIHVFDKGRIIESGEIDAVYRQPQHIQTMLNLGFPNTNTFRGRVRSERGVPVVESAICNFPLNLLGANADGKDVHITLRPQDIAVNPSADSDMITVPAELNLVEDLGGELHVYLNVNGTEMEALIPHYATDDNLVEGAATIGILPDSFKVYDVKNNLYIGQGVV